MYDACLLLLITSFISARAIPFPLWSFLTYSSSISMASSCVVYAISAVVESCVPCFSFMLGNVYRHSWHHRSSHLGHTRFLSCNELPLQHAHVYVSLRSRISA